MMRMGLPDDVLVGALHHRAGATLTGLLEGAEQAAMDSVIDPDKLGSHCRFSTHIIQEYTRA